MRSAAHKYPLVRRFMAVFVGTIVLCLLINVGLIAIWILHMGQVSHRITIQGKERGYELTVPAQAAEGPVPLVIFMHGRSQSARVMQHRTGFDTVAMREGFAVAYPNGIDKAWTVIPPSLISKYPRAADAAADMDFIDALVDDLVKKKIVDEHRVYLSGNSNGGQLTFLMACVRPARYAAAAPVVATMTALAFRECKTARPMPMLIMAGTADQYVFWNGKQDGDLIDQFTSVRESLDFWKHVNGCSDFAVRQLFPHLHPEDPSSVRTEIYPKCSSGMKVALYKIVNGGHQPPAIDGDDLWTPFLGTRNHDIDMAEELWKFFKGYRK